jgi:transcriptional regulator with XRE-family HTH domain
MSTSRLKEERKRANLTQAGLAKKAGVSKTTIVGIERGSNHPRPTTLDTLAKALEVPVRRLQGPSDVRRLRVDPKSGELDSTLPRVHTAGAASPVPKDQQEPNSINWSEPDEVPWLGCRPQIEQFEPATQQERRATFDVLTRGRLSFEELEALLFATLVNHFRRAAVTHENQPELYRARVAVLRRVLDDAECVGRNLWFAFDYSGGLSLDMDPDEPDSADLQHLREAFRRWQSGGGFVHVLNEWSSGSYPWWQMDRDYALSYETVEAYIRALTSNDPAHWNARHHWT